MYKWTKTRPHLQGEFRPPNPTSIFYILGVGRKVGTYQW